LNAEPHAERVRGTVINVHAHGALVRLDDGSLAAAPIEDVNANRSAYTRALAERSNLPFDAVRNAKHRWVRLAQTRVDEIRQTSEVPAALQSNTHFEEQVTDFLKQTQEWERADAPPAFERHFLRKKRRAAAFETRSTRGL